MKFILQSYQRPILLCALTLLLNNFSAAQFKDWSNCFTNNYDIKFNRTGPIKSCKDTVHLGTTYKGSGQTVYWSDGYTGASRVINYTGYYQVAIIEDTSLAYCIDTSEIIYIEVNSLKNTVYTDQGFTEATVCNGTSVKLNCYSSNSGGIRWNTGDTTKSITVNSSGSYYVTQKSGKCSDTSNIVKIKVIDVKQPKVTALTDTLLCWGDTAKLECSNVDGKLLWLPYYTTAKIATATEDGEYFVFVQDSISGCNAYSNRINIRFKKPKAVQLCMVTVDSATGKNKLLWKNQGEPVTKYIVYREGNVAYQYNDLGEVSNNGGNMEFIDTGSIPKSRPYSYYIAAVDSCGNLAEESKFYAHTTLHLTASLGVNGENNLNWGDYLGIYPISSYTIYRSNKNEAFKPLATVSSTVKSFSDLNPPSGGNRYYIGIDASSSCNLGSSSSETINSNMVAFGLLNSAELPRATFGVYPNPAQSQITISGLPENSQELRITTLSGQQIMIQSISASYPKIDISSISSGYYFLVFENGFATPLQIMNP